MFLDQDFPPDVRVEKEIRTLQNTGYKVTLAALSYKKNKSHEVIGGIEVVRIFGNKLLYKLSALAYTIPIYHQIIYRKIIPLVKYLQPDFLHVHDMVMAPSVLKAAKKFKIPSILDLHENRPAIMELYAHVNRVPGKYLINLKDWVAAQRNLQRLADRIILVTEEAKRYAVKNENIAEHKIYVVPNTVSKNFIDDLENSEKIEARFKDQFSILYFGDTAIRRGTDNIIESIALLNEKIENLSAIIIGTGSQDSDLRKLAEKLNVSDKIHFEGWQNIKLLKAYAKASSIGVCPFKRNLHHDTTFANKLFQFMGLGLPIIVSDCPAQVNIIESYNCGLVHKAGDSPDLADKILDLYQNPQQRSIFGFNGVKAINEELNWEQTSASLIELYTSFKK